MLKENYGLSNNVSNIASTISQVFQQQGLKNENTYSTLNRCFRNQNK